MFKIQLQKQNIKGGGLKKVPTFFLLTLKITAEFVPQGIPHVCYTFGTVLSFIG